MTPSPSTPTAADAAPDPKTETIRVRVPQQDGTITMTLRPGTKDVRRFTVTDHVVEASQADAELLLVHVDGSTLDK